MKKANFWLVQIVMVAIISLVLGSPVFAGPPDHAKSGKSVATSSDDDMSHGEEMRLDKANMDEGNAEWKVVEEPEPDPVCPPGTVGTYPDCF